MDRADEDDAYGILTFQEIVYRVIARSLPATRTRVGDVMMKPLIVVNPTLRLPLWRSSSRASASRTPSSSRSISLPGVISSSDLVKALAAQTQAVHD